MQSWYLLMTKPRQDEVAQQNLERQGFEVYRPEMTLQKARRGKPTWVVESLFPRYLFIRLCSESQDWRPIRSTKGVLQMVRFGTQFTKVPQAIIDEIKQRESALKQASDQATLYQKGEKLRIEHSSFYGLDAVFESYDADDRVIVLMNVLGQQQKIAFDAADVTKYND